MLDKEEERRKCKRFEVPGTTVRYQKMKLFTFKKEIDNDSFPVLNISRGGLLFLSQEKFFFNDRLIVLISFPEEEVPLMMKARVRWADRNPGLSYKYMIGIQFDSYGRKKRYNHPSGLDKLIELEKKFLKSGE